MFRDGAAELAKLVKVAPVTLDSDLPVRAPLSVVRHGDGRVRRVEPDNVGDEFIHQKISFKFFVDFDLSHFCLLFFVSLDPNAIGIDNV
jgi:hypothetical protein